MRTSRSNDHHCAWRGVPAILALTIIACGGKDPGPGGNTGDDLPLGPKCTELRQQCGRCTDSEVKRQCDLLAISVSRPDQETACASFWQTPTNRTACSVEVGKGTVSIRMWRTDSPQGEIAIDSDPNGPLWTHYRNYGKRSFRPSDIYPTTRTGKMTPAEIEIPEGYHLVAFYRDGHVSSVHPVTITAGGTVNVNDGRLALDLIGTMWVQVEGSWIGTRGPITTVDPTDPSCGLTDHEHGDACVLGREMMGTSVLLGTRLFYHPIGGGSSLEGRISDDRRRIEYDVASARDPANRIHYVWQRE